ncbi:MAG: phosphate/phosphite/phosphonate ABC transporter substrate-binding protein [Deltaproteobacteria bacterium]
MKWVRSILFLAVMLAMVPPATGFAAGGGKPVKIGILPSQTVKALIEKYQPLMEYLSRKVGRPFEVHPLKSYDDILQELRSGEIDGGVLGSFKAQEALSTIGAVPVARPEKGGVSSYRGYVIVRKDSGRRTIEDLKGKSFDFVSKGTSAGYVFPMALLREKKADPDRFFSRMTFAGKHEIALSKVLNRESDGAAIKDTVLGKMAKSDPRIDREITVIHKSGPFPDGTVLFRKDTPASLVRSVRQALLGIGKDPGGREVLKSLDADRFIPTDRKDFAYLSKLVKRMEGK